MSVSEILSLEQKPKDLLLKFRERLNFNAASQLTIVEVKREFEKLEPSDIRLYEKLRELSKKFPKLPEWFFVMCGTKYEDKNLKNVLELISTPRN